MLAATYRFSVWISTFSAALDCDNSLSDNSLSYHLYEVHDFIGLIANLYRGGLVARIRLRAI